VLSAVEIWSFWIWNMFESGHFSDRFWKWR